MKGSDLNLVWPLQYKGQDNIKPWESSAPSVCGIFVCCFLIQNPLYSKLIVEILDRSIANNEWIFPKKLIQKRDFLERKFCLIFGHSDLLVEVLDLISSFFLSVHDPGL